jgi:hypothetical protein
MMKAHIKQSAETAASADTSIQHCGALNMQDALKILAHKEALALQVSERVAPCKIARDFNLENPGAISVGTCACHAVQHDPCLSPPQEICPIRGKTEGRSTAPKLRSAEGSTLGPQSLYAKY